MQAPDKIWTIKSASGHDLTIKQFPTVDYQQSYDEMLSFTQGRSADTPDQIWLLQHPPVYTQGTSSTLMPLVSSTIPVIKTDRGGQITYHGPGQIVMYPLLNIKRFGLGVKSLVSRLEQSVIDVLAKYDLTAERRQNAPGIYLDQSKIGALGLRIRNGCSYHGLSFNVDMDLTPFSNIDPCGFQGLEVTQLSAYHADIQFEKVERLLIEKFSALI